MLEEKKEKEGGKVRNRMGGQNHRYDPEGAGVCIIVET